MLNALDQLTLTREQKRGLLIIAMGALAIGALFFFLSQSNSSAQASYPDVTPVTLAPTVPSLVMVDVAGKVAKPGVYSLPTGSRAIDAIKAAGNKLRGVDTSDINLAHILIDGEQIVVGAPRQVTATTKSGKKVAPKGPISINTATQAQLESLPGIGPVMASRIIAYRLKNGPFAALLDLRKVSGLGAAKFAEIQTLIHL